MSEKADAKIVRDKNSPSINVRIVMLFVGNAAFWTVQSLTY